jgi:hypothetical protein
MKTVVQRLVLPNLEINNESALFFHQEWGSCRVDTERQNYFVLKNVTARFDSYFNAFPAHLYEWDGRQLLINIKAQGQCIVKVMMAGRNAVCDTLFHFFWNFRDDHTEEIEIPVDIKLDGLIYIEFTAVTDTIIHAVDYCIEGLLARDVFVTGVITTFKRNDIIQNTGRRLQKYFKNNSDLNNKFQLLVIDNGGDTDSISFDNGRVIKNKNLGGSGGFTRGLLEVFNENLSTHVLFMDDDASFFPESLRRTISILQFTTKENLAISGAMIAENHRWRMWENAARFDKRCIPIDSGRDLRDFNQVVAMSIEQPRDLKNKYGAWWYFCFPINSVKTWPFPFFVRGDDIYFSLSNHFDIITAPGIVAHQEDFAIKQSPLTLYLDLRNHIVHHLTFDDIDLNASQLRKMVGKFFHRYNNSYHYESAAAINQAIEDVLLGEIFWENNIDMLERRKLISSWIHAEKIKSDFPVNMQEGLTMHSARRNQGKWIRYLRKITLNGHLLPQWLFYKKGVCFPMFLRGIEHDSFRRPFTVTLDEEMSQGYQCWINRKAYFNNLFRFRSLSRNLAARIEELKHIYRGASKSLTNRAAWERRFHD